MKSLSDAAFFRAFDALASAGDPGLKRVIFDFASVHWERERISVARASYSIVQEIFTLTHGARPKWTLLVVKEYWWGAAEGNALRSVRWSRPMSGRRADILAWFREQDRSIGQAAAACERRKEKRA